MAKLRSSQFTFRKNDTVGAEGAELDHLYLEDCFYDHGDLDIIRDCSNPSCIIVGRTGSGKTALIMKLQEDEENIISIEPENLSLQYLSNSTILPQVEALGVNLGLFYKLLWRHIFAVELIKSKYSLRTEDQSRKWWETFWDIFSKDKEKEKAIEYLRKWGEEFWKDTEYRVREVTSKLETNVKDTLGVKWPSILNASMSNEEKCSVEEKADVVKRLQEVVDSIQVRELSKVIKMLGDSVFEKPQPRFYVLLDKLDETWVADHFRYRLIKALIETVSDVNHHMNGVKVVVAIRRDLLNMVIQETRETGFQEEKYEPLYVNMKWTKEELFEMLNRRVNKLLN